MSDLELRLEPKQALRISPQLLQATRMLLMPAQELSHFLERAAEENPLLERIEHRTNARGSSEPVTFVPEAGRWDSAMASLSASLTGQLERRHLDKPTAALCRYMVELLDDNGYLDSEDMAAIQHLGIDPALIDRALAVLQSLEPAGVGARSVEECLLLQLQRHRPREPAAEEIVIHCLPLLGKKQYATIARQLRLPESEVRRAYQIIQQLEPYPARNEQPDDEPVYVIPDVIIEEADGQWQAALNERYLPRFSVSRQYLELLESSGDTEVQQYLKEKLRQAQWMLACLEKRQSTLQRCADLILQTQSDFFQGATAHLTPMTMRAAAERMQVHESTVGRCVKDKYLQCRQGTFPLRYFFSGEVNGFSGQAVRMEIRALVRAEDGHRPLSDSRIADMLDAKGISVARRTVAKYRQEMGIPPACQRKQA